MDGTVNAGEIARLVDVGRAAVSNWRRRHDDFPQPVGGTASSPLFSLAEVENWLRRNGKSYQVSRLDRVWQRLRAAGDDLRLGEQVAQAGLGLLRLRDRVNGTCADEDLAALARELGYAEAFEALVDRYVSAHSRRLFVTPPRLAAALGELIGDAATVLDPACGLGGLLLAAPNAAARGQEIDPVAAAIARARLSLAGRPNTVVAGDSLLGDGFAGELADAVVCDPPFNERGWGHEELAADPRWTYGLPPRGESELAWVQHCLAHVRPGGLVVLLMPGAAASRRPGKRIRGNLLRAGALRAICALAPGGPDLWVLRRPEPGERPPARVLLDAESDPDTVVERWRRFVETGGDTEGAVPIVDLLDDDVDLSPARHRPQNRDTGRAFARVRAALRDAELLPPALTVPADRQDLPAGTVGELARAGLLSIVHAPGKVDLADVGVPVLTADDLAEGRPPSARTEPAAGLVPLAAGDVVATPAGMARVLGPDLPADTVLGPYLARYRVDPEALDPDFLAGFLRAAAPRGAGVSSRIDARRARVPRLPLAEQRAYGRAFRELAGFADRLRAAAELGETLVRLGFDGLVDGDLRPGGRG